MHFSRILILLALICIGSALLAGCTTKSPNTPAYSQQPPVSVKQTTGDEGISWMTIPVTDDVTGTQTTVVELASQGRPVIMHTFAVWCPACTMQLRATKSLYEKNPDRFYVIGVDIDPRENSAQIKNHVEKNKFVGKYIAAPPEFTRSLMNTVGPQILQSLPQTVIICNQSVTYIGDGAFSEQKLDAILSEICR